MFARSNSCIIRQLIVKKPVISRCQFSIKTTPSSLPASSSNRQNARAHFTNYRGGAASLIAAAVAFGGFAFYSSSKHIFQPANAARSPASSDSQKNELQQQLERGRLTQRVDPSTWLAPPVTDAAELENGSVKSEMERFCMQLQADFCRDLERHEALANSDKRFLVDKWHRTQGGGGISCILQDGAVLEKAGVNISSINGVLSPAAVAQMRARFKELDPTQSYKFSACGISSVIHPRNPKAPTLHFNFRYLEVTKPEDNSKIWWFGGGSDLTPNFLFEEDAQHFHATIKRVCDQFDVAYYPKYKAWCDKYFYLPHRKEARGVGGIFFDDHDFGSAAESFEFARGCGLAVPLAYLPLLERRKSEAYSEADRSWQLVRRGRYVEFNLIHDRGTKFGLATPEARIESILMSLPLHAQWWYCHEPPPHPRILALLDVLHTPRDWTPAENDATANQ